MFRFSGLLARWGDCCLPRSLWDPVGASASWSDGQPVEKLLALLPIRHVLIDVTPISDPVPMRVGVGPVGIFPKVTQSSLDFPT